MVFLPCLVTIHVAKAEGVVGLEEAIAEVDEAGEELEVLKHLGQFNFQSRKPAGILHEAIAQTVLRASTLMIHHLNLGLLAANRLTPSLTTERRTVLAKGVSRVKGHCANDGKCIEGKVEDLSKVSLLTLRVANSTVIDAATVRGVVNSSADSVMATVGGAASSSTDNVKLTVRELQVVP